MNKQYGRVLVVREPIERLAKLTFIVQLLARTLPLDNPIRDRTVPPICIMHFGTLIVCRPRRPTGGGRPLLFGLCCRSPRSPPSPVRKAGLYRPRRGREI